MLILNRLQLICVSLFPTVFQLTFYCSRHTYASEITLSQGIPIETVSRMLGHSDIKTTQIYAKVTNDKIDEDTRGLDERVAKQFKFAI